MSDYTPSTDEVRGACMATGPAASAVARALEFERWLEQVRAEERERITAQSASGTVSTISDLNGPEVTIRLDNPDDLRLFGVFQSARIAKETT